MKSENIKELATALAKAQLEIKGAVKNRENDFKKYCYTDLASVWDACHEPMNKHGISIVQTTYVSDGNVYLKTRLIHSSGEYLESDYPIDPVKKDPQGMGSSMTYARRYCLAAICGVCAIEDDDGVAASEPAPAPAPGKAKAEIFYDPENKMHKTTMMSFLAKKIPYDDSKKELYQKVNQLCKGEPLASLEQRVHSIVLEM